jgi:hypothetical protein
MTKNLASKAVAAILLGLGLAIALCGLYGWLGPGTMTDKYMVVLWLLVPVWLTVVSCSFFFKTAKQAWLVLIGANIVTFTLLAVIRTALS